MYRRTAYLGTAVALALIVSYIETLIPISFGIPGVKLGLTNIVIVFILYRMDWKSAFLVSLLRICLAGFLFGNMSAILYSMSGGIISLIGMAFLKKKKGFSILGVSIAGGVLHNTGQLAAAMLVVGSFQLLYYASVLLLAGLLTGALVGILTGEMIRRIPKPNY